MLFKLYGTQFIDIDHLKHTLQPGENFISNEIKISNNFSYDLVSVRSFLLLMSKNTTYHHLVMYVHLNRSAKILLH